MLITLRFKSRSRFPRHIQVPQQAKNKSKLKNSHTFGATAKLVQTLLLHHRVTMSGIFIHKTLVAPTCLVRQRTCGKTTRGVALRRLLLASGLDGYSVLMPICRQSRRGLVEPMSLAMAKQLEIFYSMMMKSMH